MTKPLGNPVISPEALQQMRERAGTWAAYQNVALDSSDLGDLRFLQVGPTNTFKEAPEKYPDTQFGIGWRYVHVGFVNLATGAIDVAPPKDGTAGQS